MSSSQAIYRWGVFKGHMEWLYTPFYLAVFHKDSKYFMQPVLAFISLLGKNAEKFRNFSFIKRLFLLKQFEEFVESFEPVLKDSLSLALDKIKYEKILKNIMAVSDDPTNKNSLEASKTLLEMKQSVNRVVAGYGFVGQQAAKMEIANNKDALKELVSPEEEMVVDYEPQYVNELLDE